MASIELKPLPDKDAIEYFRQKGYKIGFNHQDVWQEEHQAYFTVAKAMTLDILKDIRAWQDKAQTEGISFGDFQKNLQPLLEKKGWWGKRVMEDPATGEAQLAQLGSVSRLRLIYDTNLRTSHAEGQWQRIQATKDTFPYLMYSGGHSAHPRHLHLSWNGMVLPVDDPWWLAHKPVKAYRCKCRVIQQTEGMLKRAGREVGIAPKETYRTYTNKRTGEVQRIPAGVDPGFNYPPKGRLASLQAHLQEKLDALPAPLRDAALKARVVGDVDAGFRQAIDKTLQSIPAHVRKEVYAAGYEVRIAKSLTDIKPSLAGVKPRGHKGVSWENIDGVLLVKEKVIAVAETCINPITGKPYPVDLERSSSVLLHEYGHAYDLVASLSAEERFVHAYNTDSSAINAGIDSRDSKVQYEIDYMLQPGAAGKQEVFAELFARLHGKSTASFVNALTMFPSTARVVDSMLKGKK